MIFLTNEGTKIKIERNERGKRTLTNAEYSLEVLMIKARLPSIRIKFPRMFALVHCRSPFNIGSISAMVNC